MPDFATIKKTSTNRISIVIALLLLWTLGVTFIVSYISPLEEIIASAPLGEEEKKTAQKQLDRLTLQSDSATVLAKYSDSLLVAYSDATQQIKKFLKYDPAESAFQNYQTIVHAVTSIETNKSVILTDSRGSRSNKVLSTDYRYSNYDTQEKPATLKELSLHVWQPLVTMAQQEVGTDNYRTNPVDLASLTPVMREGMEYKPVILGNDASYANRIEAAMIFTEQDGNISVLPKGDRDTPLYAFLDWVSEGKSSDNLNNRAEKNIQQIITALETHIEKLQKQKTQYDQAKISYNNQLKGLQSRLRSSESLFFVATFRAFLVTIVIISIGFVLIRAFAAELTQMRRVSYLEIAADLTSQYPAEVLKHMPDIIRAVGGDKAGAPTLSDGSPPDAITVAEKLGNAVSKFSTASKPL
ncbi:hypothetical protein [Sneathiella sp.]|jgi:hypothetical protein|uniref:hypothetical protein n=1 Tax=Sneathiella sp. TaxID=1964365 RepID=UPI0039E716D5